MEPVYKETVGAKQVCLNVALAEPLPAYPDKLIMSEHAQTSSPNQQTTSALHFNNRVR
jgi:hypothetical protein